MDRIDLCGFDDTGMSFYSNIFAMIIITIKYIRFLHETYYFSFIINAINYE
ncbi:MAG: hypothetical protein QM315_03055 [Bacillota bacterium]|nr:hypothetical protein [Bacillota bacterium]NLV64019.1 hypothetical protein [Clostridiaceae bacterium]